MGIHQDARDGALTKKRLKKYLSDDPSILDRLDDEGQTPLTAAAVAGYADEVEFLLSSGAKADAPCRNGETPLLLVTSKTAIDRARIAQLLLAKMPSSSVDTTSRVSRNNTALMFAIQKKDVECIRLLRRAGASTTARNDDGATAQDLASQAGAVAVIQALDPEKEQTSRDQWGIWNLKLMLYTVAWFNDTKGGAVRRLYKLNPSLDEQLDEVCRQLSTLDGYSETRHMCPLTVPFSSVCRRT
jgi:ankyrin repeat protein